MEINALLSQKSINSETGLPEALKGYLDVFSPRNAAKLALNREGIDLVIKT